MQTTGESIEVHRGGRETIIEDVDNSAHLKVPPTQGDSSTLGGQRTAMGSIENQANNFISAYDNLNKSTSQMNSEQKSQMFENLYQQQFQNQSLNTSLEGL